MICVVFGLGLPAILCATVVALAIIEAEERRDAREAERDRRDMGSE